MRPQPLDEIMHLDIAPHPGREAREGFFGRRFMRMVADVAVDACGVGPIRLDGNDAEPVLFDQAARDRRAGSVELRRAMSRFPEEDDLRIREAVETRAELLRVIR